ncbi:serine/threonine-protein phosphatase 4 regulatory subunit 4 isoform X3 [Apis mellifera]|uniref:Serine/threonine-protein phosphatase 4 regulatory subunit 4 isoform X3 n=1 Tax=Apis mellifera TaxID=7460 RepID=A0A7M7LMJ4_APIME|nr:serine/threonine-protein phosphatase 4 regulatory subunit 4 isoform X3 [Apis mellifera]|eukprot:XP_006560925.2 serine/threonine-protein phosphatase 4 regulatory subunit 4 isoform X3 [Apis mellifera]
MLQEEALYKSTSPRKGDEIQKLNFIQTLPNLLATETESCITRVIPKLQQSLATASTEFHIAASTTFKTILEQKLVNHNVFSRTFLQSILESLEKRDPVICHAWLETLLDVIELLPIETIRKQILPLSLSKGQLSQPIYSRIICSKILGKICTRFESGLIQKEVLPMVHSLCQDVNNEVRANICLQLRFVAEGLNADTLKTSLLPSLVELASDEESNVRCAAVETIAYLLPYFQEETIKTIIVPLIKKLCETSQSIYHDNSVICVISQEFGKIVLGLEKCLLPAEKTWFLKYYQQLSQMGIVIMRKESKHHIPFMDIDLDEDEKYVECRRCCAFNLPAMFIFVSNSPDDTDSLLLTFTALANDHYYLVRRTVACGIHEVAKVLGPKSGRIKTDLIKLLKDNSEEVLQGIAPHIALILECLLESHVIGIDKMDSIVMEIGRALLKCESEIAGTHNWRLVSLIHSQFEVLPKYFPSDFIYSYFVPMAFFRILHARAIPIRLSSGNLYLIFLRYNIKPAQRVELRTKLCSELANNANSYSRMMFVRIMMKALEIFSSAYFKEHFYTTLLSLAEDNIANIRMKVVNLMPQLKSLLRIPADKKLLTILESTVTHLINSEKDRDVLNSLTIVIKKLDETILKYESRMPTGVLSKQEIEDNRKFEEEKKISGMAIGKAPVPKKGVWRQADSSKAPQTTSKDSITSPRPSAESLKTSSMPEIPVMLSDDEFLVDAGIRIPVQFSQSTSKIPHLQDSIFGKRRTSFNHIRPTGMNFDKGKPKRNSSVEYEDCIKRRTNTDQSNHARTSIDCEDGLRLVKENQQLGKKDPIYVGPLIRSRFGFGVNQDRTMDDKMKRRNSLILDKEKPKVVQSKCTLDRTKRNSVNFEKGKPKRNFSAEYEDGIKRRTNGTNHVKGIRLRSIDYEDGLSLVKENQQQDKKDHLYLGPVMRSRFGYSVNQERAMDDKMKRRNSLILDKDKPKIVQTKCMLDRTKRHSANFSLKMLDTKETKTTLKDQHSLEVTEYTPSERLSRALRRYSTLDVNHNQGHSKIPLRSFVRRSRTAPATRASSPVGSQFRYEEIDKLCRKFEEYQLY